MSAKRLITLNNGNKIPAFGLGTYDIPNSSTAQVVYEACKVGYKHFDTAVLYGNEREVGEGIHKYLTSTNTNRGEIFYTTKLWNSQLGYQNTKRAIKDIFSKVSQLEYIDLVLIHSPLPGKTKRLESWKALEEAVEEGLIKNIGVSNYGIHHIDELLSHCKIKPVVNQIEISPWCMRQELADYCLLKNIQVEAFSPLTHGYRLRNPPAELQALADKYNVNVGQLLIKWSLSKGYIPLPKTQRVERLQSNLSVDHFELTKEEVESIQHPEVHDPTDWECTDAP
ncbi:Aldo/keto reductase [Hyphopichia burtonii NRRL Y-1933]|uniref:2-dehydropantolactone reductase n=1 Tax=Hyphopichia burtonii NRRL Y-1933 TaxID=984485 RepID=A0A1E4RKG2_9ASCO|nr:Aldo/keto reductase [Hyphopichia burtonii NRRL Y-1933]ODV67733.1 Aldo/keto reductase [Hyphopichia burtonii NRRL Y-1933]